MRTCCVECQKNALRAVLRRFKGGLGIKPLDTHQINFKRITVASEEKKGQARYKSKTIARVIENTSKTGQKTSYNMQ